MTNKPEDDKPQTSEERQPAPRDQIIEVQHTATIGGQEISYTVTTGTLVLKEETEKKGDKAGEVGRRETQGLGVLRRLHAQ